jgi:hypothetical protein
MKPRRQMHRKIGAETAGLRLCGGFLRERWVRDFSCLRLGQFGLLLRNQDSARLSQKNRADYSPRCPVGNGGADDGAGSLTRVVL